MRRGSEPRHDDDDDDDDSDNDEEDDEETRTLIRAAEESAQTGSIGPILKEELKAKIQLRRLQSGQDELVLDFKEPTYEMTIEEIQKRNQKREQNRLSALRTRERQKVHEYNLLQKIKRLEENKQRLTKEREKLRQELQRARQSLTEHLKSCDRQDRDRQLQELETPSTSGTLTSLPDEALQMDDLQSSCSDTSDESETVQCSSQPQPTVQVAAPETSQSANGVRSRGQSQQLP